MDMILEVNSVAAYEKDSTEKLPLHHVLYKQASLEVVQLIIQAYPMAMYLKDGKKNSLFTSLLK